VPDESAASRLQVASGGCFLVSHVTAPMPVHVPGLESSDAAERLGVVDDEQQ